MGPSSAPSRVECPNRALSLPNAVCSVHNERAVLYKGRRGPQYPTFTILHAHVRRHRRYCRAVASAPQGATDVHSDDEITKLRLENGKLRAAVADVLSQLSPEVQSRLIEEHRSLRASAAAIGEPLPQITSEGVLEDAPVETQATEDPADFVLPTPSEVGHEEEAGPLDVLDASLEAPAAAESEAPAIEAEAPAVKAEEPAAGAEYAPEDVEESAPVAAEKRGWQLTPEGDAAVLQGDDETITFSFGSLVDKIKKNLTASASAFGGRKSSNAGLAAPPPPGALPKQSLTAASIAASVQRMQAMSDERAESEGARSGRSKAATVVVDHPKSSEEGIVARDIGGGAETEPLQDSHQTTKGETIDVDEEMAEEARQYGGGQDNDPLQPKHSAADTAAGLAAAAASGREELAQQKEAEAGPSNSVGDVYAPAAGLVKGKEHWLYFVHPEKPAAGAEVAVYFNNNVSDILRDRPRRQIHVKFNNWELEGENGSWFNLEQTDAPHDFGADWWRVIVKVPEDAFEMNYVFTDGEGATDNNMGQNYLTLLDSNMTAELWAERAMERQVAAEKKRKAEEAAAREAAEVERRQRADADDRAAAQQRALDLRQSVAYHREGAVARLERSPGQVAWFTEPEGLMPGKRAKLLYNASAGPLAFMAPLPSAPSILLGHNGWLDTQEVIMEKATGVSQEGNWWAVEFDVFPDAAVINFVVKYYEHFDNNEGQDFKALVELDALGGSLDDFQERKAEEIYQRLRQQRKELEEEWQRKGKRRTEMRTAAKAKAMAVLRRQMKHVLFTEPAMIQAGQDVTIYYNPQDTPLKGGEEVYLTGGWNRWKHLKKFGPLRMTTPGDGDHFSATVTVPKNAHSIDFVLSNVPEGEGIYDNRGGLDYHLPVEGSELTPPGLHVVHIAVEMAPICKVGGLGDVVTALGRAVQEQGHMVEVILPRYDFFLQSPLLGATQYETEFDWGGTHIWVSTCIVQGLRCFFIEPANGFFAVNSVYGRNDDAMRFEFFNKAALEFLLQTGRQPDILHCHDWSTAGTAQAFWDSYVHYGLWRPKVVFTIHNAEYGLDRIGSAAYYSQRFTTVSPSYAFEIGGNPAIAAHAGKFMGIRNGIDVDIWDPENDDLLPRPYNADSVVEGKAAARETLRYRLGLTGWGDKPLVGVVTRLTEQKGLHLIKHAAWRTLERGGQFVLLGSAPDPKIQAQFNALAATLGGENAHFAFSYDESLSHLIYAGCDIICVPSMFEPCGLTQLIAMRYGSVPVVRSTGGLRDTVFDVDVDKARAAWELEGSSDWERDGLDVTNGFTFEGTDGPALDYALNRALDAYYNDRAWWHSLAARIMRQDWSWNRPALDYIELYYQAMK
ncbi:g4948 [Coccomyxa elongata]